MIKNIHTLYILRPGKTQREIHQRVRDERDRFQIRDVEPSPVDYDPLHIDATLHEVVSWRVYD